MGKKEIEKKLIDRAEQSILNSVFTKAFCGDTVPPDGDYDFPVDKIVSVLERLAQRRAYEVDGLLHNTLFGIKFKCEAGHIWQSAVATIWCQMPLCPECHRPATAWTGLRL
jgi:hypothetical protein